MKNKSTSNIVYLILFLCSFSYRTIGQNSLSLADCLQQINKSDPGNEELIIVNDILEKNIAINNRSLWPKASLSGKSTWQSTVASIPIDLPGLDIPKVKKDQYGLAIDVVQSIYTGGIAKESKKLFQIKNDIYANDIDTKKWINKELAINLFHQIILQKSLIQLNQISVSKLDQYITRINNGINNGTLIKNDLRNFQVKKLELDQAKQNAIALRKTAKQALSILLEKDSSSFTIKEVQDKVAQTSSASKFEGRPELKALKLSQEQIDISKSINSILYKPKLSAFATAGYGRPGLDFFSSQFDFYGIIGLNLKIPLDHYYTNKLNQENSISDLNKRLLQTKKTSIVRQLEIKENNFLNEISKIEHWILTDLEIIELREEMLKTAKNQWDAGVITSRDFLDVENDLFLAKEQIAIHKIQLLHQQMLLLNLIDINAFNK